ncbi:hypothetical protein WBJ53_05545 [Spirosoma sp. SC4-14]|uniref:hypothetical protein n=1 Tax=Spirosoma sp. SC4-14 TaxID=3128900 RepID=UPI0030CB960B
MEEEELLKQRQTYNIRLLTIFFLYVTFNGAIRKWILTDGLTANLLLGIQIGMPVLFALLAKTKPASYFTRVVMGGYSLLLIAMAFNPLAQTPFHGLIGYFLHIGVYLPLLVYMDDREAFPVERMNRLFLIIILIELGLGVIQFMSPANSFINKYVRDTSESGGVATLYAVQRVRITGTYSYIGGLTALFTFFGFWVWGLRLMKASVLLIVTILIACAVIAPMTGSRGLLAMLVILVGCSFLSTITDVRTVIGLAGLGGLFLLISQYIDVSLVEEAYAGINHRIVAHLEDGETEDRVFGQILEIIDFRGAYPLFGTGLGGTYQGAKALFGESIYLQEYGYYEEEPERIVLEGGFLLFFVRLFLWGLLARRSTIPALFGAILVYLLVFNSATVYNVNVVFYSVMGWIYLDRSYYLRQNDL